MDEKAVHEKLDRLCKDVCEIKRYVVGGPEHYGHHTRLALLEAKEKNRTRREKTAIARGWGLLAAIIGLCAERALSWFTRGH